MKYILYGIVPNVFNKKIMTIKKYLNYLFYNRLLLYNDHLIVEWSHDFIHTRCKKKKKKLDI